MIAHTLISRFVDHLPYYRQEAINARSGVHTPRSTLAQWSGRAGAALEPLYEAHKRFVLQARVLHADETPVAMLDPGRGKTKRAYVWAYAKPGVGLLVHADWGSQYAGHEYRRLTADFGIVMSMSRKGNAWDNAAMESFFKTLKVERIYQVRYSTRAQARLDIVDWIEGFYNRVRIHSANGYLTPVTRGAHPLGCMT